MNLQNIRSNLKYRQSFASPMDHGVRTVSLLNVFSLDAPLIAIVWQFVISKSISVELSPHHHLILGLSVWLAYSADRFSEPHAHDLPKAKAATKSSVGTSWLFSSFGSPVSSSSCAVRSDTWRSIAFFLGFLCLPFAWEISFFAVLSPAMALPPNAPKSLGPPVFFHWVAYSSHSTKPLLRLGNCYRIGWFRSFCF